jgi:hypothetical protein
VSNVILDTHCKWKSCRTMTNILLKRL